MPKRQPRAPHAKRKVKLDHETAATPATHQSGHGAERERNGVNLLPARIEPLKATRRSGREVHSMEKTKKDGFAPMANMSEMNATFQKNAKKIAAWYIDTVENLAKEGLTLREKTTSWAKETPLAAIFEAQNVMAQQLVENSASFARSIFQLDKEEDKPKRSVEA